MRKVYQAFDGGVFEDADLCRSYEANHIADALVGCSKEDIEDAIALKGDAGKALATAIEAVNSRIQRTKTSDPSVPAPRRRGPRRSAMQPANQ